MPSPALHCSHRWPSRASLQRLIDVPENIIERFESDRQPDHFRRNTGGTLLFFVELAMRGRRRMNDQRLGIADIGQMRQELDRLDESHAGRGASFDAKSKDASRTSREVALRQRLVAISLQQRVADPVDTGMRSEMPSDGQCRLTVAWHAQVQRLDPLQQQERAKRSERRPKRSDGFHASFHGEAEIAEGLVEEHSVIATRWCGHLRELAVSPVKLSGLDDDSAHGRAVTAQVLGRGMNYDVGAVLQRSAQKRRSERVVDD